MICSLHTNASFVSLIIDWLDSNEAAESQLRFEGKPTVKTTEALRYSLSHMAD